jgi:hypothetical protein
MFLFPLIVAVLAFAVTAELNAIPTELDNVNTRGNHHDYLRAGPPVHGDLCGEYSFPGNMN